MRRDLVRCYYASNNSTSAALRMYKTEKHLVKDPCHVSAISKLIKKFESTYSLLDQPRSGRHTIRDSRLQDVKEAVVSTETEIGSTSIRRVSQETGIPRSSVARIMREDLLLYPYKFSLHQELNETDKIYRKEFAQWLLDDLALLPKILWSDEAYISMDGSISRHNCRIWSTCKPQFVMTEGLHPEKICVWFGFTSSFGLKPYFFDSTVNSENYLEMLQGHMQPLLQQKRQFEKVTFMQDGAAPHYAKRVRDYLCQTFTSNRVISRGCKNPWPARSPDINPLDFWFWATLKARIFHCRQPTSLEHLKALIISECEKFTPDEFAMAVSNIPKRLECLLHFDGGHFEHML